MQRRPTRSPWFTVTLTLARKGSDHGWRRLGNDVGSHMEFFLREFYEPADESFLRPLVREFKALISGPLPPIVDWLEEHLPDLVAGADDHERGQLILGMSEASGVFRAMPRRKKRS